MTAIRTYHPWWTHLPAIVLALVSVGLLASVASLPGPAPVHFGFHGPDRWGSPLEVPFAFALACFVVFTVSFAIDGLWAQSERGGKRFNFFCILDELVMAFLLGATVSYVDWRHHPHGPPDPGHPLVWLAGIVAVVAALVIELLRPVGPSVERERVDTHAFVRELAARQAAGQRWVYWSEQAPLAVRLMVLLPIGLVILVLVNPTPRPMWLAIAVATAGAVLTSGGFRTQVTPAGLELRAGSWGPRLVRLAGDEIVEAAVCEFHPLRQFGGWGIRLGSVDDKGRVWGFFLEGNTGVLLRSRKGKRYLIGAADPERLLAVVNVARGATA
jgi:hypothetical protein